MVMGRRYALQLRTKAESHIEDCGPPNGEEQLDRTGKILLRVLLEFDWHFVPQPPWLPRNLGLDELRKLCERLLPAEIAHLERNSFR
jgi:hypothetical protein